MVEITKFLVVLTNKILVKYKCTISKMHLRQPIYFYSAAVLLGLALNRSISKIRVESTSAIRKLLSAAQFKRLTIWLVLQVNIEITELVF